MFFRMISVLLCSCLLAVSIPQVSYGAEETAIEEAMTESSIAQDTEESEEEAPSEPEASSEDEEEPSSEELSDEEPSNEEFSSEESSVEESSSEEPSNSESSSEDLSSTETSSSEESSSTETTSSEESSSTETTSSEESSSTETTSSEESSSTETTDSEESSDTQESTEEETSKEPSKEETKEEETEEEETEEEETTDEETEEEETTEEETTTEEESTEKQIGVEVATLKDTVEIKNGVFNSVVLKHKKAQWFQFIAPETGYYNFCIQGSNVGGVSVAIYDRLVDGVKLKGQSYQNMVRYALIYLEKGQTVYPQLSYEESGSAIGKTVQFGITGVTIASVGKTSGGYTTNAGNFTAQIGWRAASRTVSADIKLSARNGAALDGSYYWQIRYGNSEKGYQYIEEQILPEVKKERMINALNAGTEYNFTMYLINANTLALEAVLIPEGNPIKMQTGSSHENLIFRSKRAGYDSVTLEVEAVEPVAKYSYGPLGEYDKEVTVQRQINGISSITVTGLEPAQTYYFEFYNRNGVTFAYTTVDTKEYPAVVNYSAKASGPDSVALRADITAFSGKVPAYFNLCYEITDQKGKLIVSDIEKLATKDRDKWSIVASISDLEHSTPYLVTMWINEPGYSAHFKEKTLEVKTDVAPFPESALSVAIKQSKEKSTNAEYMIAIAEDAVEITGKLKYRMKNSLGEYETKIIYTKSSTAKGIITGLQEGAAYEYEVRIAGIVKRGTFQMGKARINPRLTADTGAYDSAISYGLDQTELTEDKGYHYKLYYYNEETKLYAELRTKTELTTVENYTISVQVADYFTLSPDTEYGFKWELFEGNTLVNTQYQRIHTKKSDVAVSITANLSESITCTIALKGRTENITKDITLFAYVQEESGTYYKNGSSFNLYASKGYEMTGYTISGLVDEQSYTVFFRDIKGKEYGTYTFTFDAKIDGVRVSAGNQIAGAHNITLQTQIEGEPAPGSYLVLFFKEKDQVDWDIRTTLLAKDQTECNFELTSYLGDDVNADTVYEFVAGISSEQYPPITATLDGYCSGEILTQTDGRSLTNVMVASGYSYISIKAMITNNPINTSSYLYVFYREKGAEDWIKSKKSYIISKTTGGMLTFINGLKPGTEYEYKVAVSDSGYDVMLSDIEEDRQVSGSIMTQMQEFSLDLISQPWSVRYGATLKVKVDTTAQEKNLKAVLTFDNKKTRELLLPYTKDYSGVLYLDDLSLGERCTVTSVELQVMETVTGECSYVTVASFTPECTITAPPHSSQMSLIREWKKIEKKPYLSRFVLYNY
ncbi:hypothetical protein IMSAGC011_00837 [Lachnospiraceae bacterium]|nr:hypothetical protein IMSAGC011_00837 [Lachnospiraceae bacterium]